MLLLASGQPLPVAAQSGAGSAAEKGDQAPVIDPVAENAEAKQRAQQLNGPAPEGSKPSEQGGEEDGPKGSATFVAPEPLPPAEARAIESEAFAERLPDGEYPNLRTATSSTFDNGDGTLTTTYSAEPKHYKDTEGDWQPIDTRLIPAEDGGYTTGASSVEVEISPTTAGTDPLARVTDGTASVGFRLDDSAADAPAKVEESTATFVDAWPSVDLSVSATPTGVKELITLSAADAPSHFRFPLELQGVEPRLEKETDAVVLVDPAGAERFRMPSAWVADSAVDPKTGDQVEGRSDVVTYSLVQDKDGSFSVEVSLDEKWLAAPERVFPITIDPSIVNITPSDDTYVSSCFPTTNYATASGLFVGGSTCQRSAFVRFDMGLLLYPRILEAELGAYNAYSASCSARNVSVYKVTQPWTQSTVTYPGPTFDSTPVASASFAKGNTGCPGGYQNWDVTSVVQAWVDGSPNYGFALRSSTGTETDNLTYKEFNSTDAGFGPNLQVTWTPHRANYTVAQSWSRNVQANQTGKIDVLVFNAGWETWTAGGSTPYRLSYHLLDSNGVEVTTAQQLRSPLPNDMGHNDFASVPVEIEALSPGTYSVVFDMVIDGTGGPIWFTDEGNSGAQLGFTVVNVMPWIKSMAPIGQTDTHTPVLAATALNPDLWPWVQTQYEFRICTDETLQANCQVSAWQTGPTYTPTLDWNKQYWWRVRVREGTDQSTLQTAPTQPLMALVPQPRVGTGSGAETGSDDGGVNPATGNFSRSFTDAQINAPGVPLSIVRTYNSSSTREGWFGRGWSTPFEASLTREPLTDTVLVTLGDGTQQRFGRNPAGTWATPPGSQDQLSGSYALDFVFATADGQRYAFDTSDQLQTVTDVNGHGVRIVRSGAQITFESTVDPTRKLIAGLTGSRITTVTAPAVAGAAQALWSYTYDAATSKLLQSVCLPQAAPNCSVLTNGTSGGAKDRLTKIVLPRGNTALELSYRPDATIEWRKDGVGNQWNYADDRADRAGLFHPVVGARILNATGIAPNSTTEVAVVGVGGANGVPATGVQSVAVNITVVGAPGEGYLKVWPKGETAPPTSSLNVKAGDTLDELHIVKVGADGKINIRNVTNGTANTQIIVDVVGYFGTTQVANGSTYHPETGSRLVDTRAGAPPGSQYTTAWPAATTRDLIIAGQGGAPLTGVTGVLLNIGSPSATASGYVRTWASGDTEPGISTMQVVSSTSRDNLVLVKVGADGKIKLKNTLNTSLHLTVDLVGWFGDAAQHADGAVFVPHTAAGTTGSRLLDTRPATQIGEYDEPWAANENRWLTLAGQEGIPANDLAAVVADIETVAPTASSNLTAWPAGAPKPTTSALLARPNRSTANALAGYKLSGDGRLSVANGAAVTDIILDVSGYFTYTSRTTTVTNPRGKSTQWKYDAKGRLTEKVDQLSFARTFTYNSAGQLQSIIDEGDGSSNPNNHSKTRFGYDDRGNRITKLVYETLTSTPKVTTYGYSPTGSNPGAGNRLLWEHDARSTLDNAAAPDRGATTDTRFETLYTYDSSGRRTSERPPITPDYPGPVGRTRSWTYTTGSEAAVGSGGVMPSGLPRTSVGFAGGVTTYSYNSAGDLTRLQLPGGSQVNYTYDGRGRPTTTTEVSDTYPSGVVLSTKTYDSLNRTLTATGPEISNPVSGVAHQTSVVNLYDANGLIDTVTTSDAKGNDIPRVTSYDYDNADRVVSYVDPVTVATTYTYDGNSNLQTETSVGEVTRYTYTDRDELWTVVAEDVVDDPIGAPGTTRDVQTTGYGYSPTGLLTSAINGRGVQTDLIYSAEGNLLSATLADFHEPGGGTHDVQLEAHTYDAAGHLESSTLNAGTSFIDYTIDNAGRTSSEVLEPGTLNRTLTYGYTKDNLISSTQLSDGTRTEATTLEYNAHRKMSKRTIADGANPAIVTTYAYDQRGLLTGVTDPGSNTVNLTNDAIGRLSSVLQPQVTVQEHGATAPNAPVALRPTSTFGYDTYGQATEERDPRSNILRTTYDALGRTVRKTAPQYTTPAGNIITSEETYSYNTKGDLTAKVDPRGYQTDYTYNTVGRLVRSLDPAVGAAGRGATTYKWDDGGNLVQLTDQIGALTTWEYDDRGRTTKEIETDRYPTSNNFTTTFTYDDAGRLTATSDPMGVDTTYGYNDALELTSVSDDAGNATTITRDVGGRAILETAPAPISTKTKSTFSIAGRLEKVEQQNAAGVTLADWEIGYNPDGSVASATDANSKTTTYSYDAAGRLTGSHKPVQTSSSSYIDESWGYDAAGNQTRFTNGENVDFWTTYQSWNLIEREIEPSTSAYPALADRTWTRTYDKAGNAVLRLGPGGATRTTTLDELGRPATETGSGSEASTTTRTLGFDAASRLTSVSRPGGNIGITRNDRDLPLSVTDTTTTSYAYNASGGLTSQTDSAGTTSYTYNSRGLLENTTDPLTGAVLKYEYDEAARTKSAKWGASGPAHTYTYNDQGQMETDVLKNGTTMLYSALYGYDFEGNLTSKTIAPSGTAGAGLHQYSYDEANRLKLWTPPTGSPVSYVFDDAGNLTSNGGTTQTFNARNQLTSSVTGGTTTTYTWWKRGTLKTTQVGANPSTTMYSDAFDRPITDGSSTYSYDGLDRRRGNGTDTLNWSGLTNNVAAAGTSLYSHDGYGIAVAGRLSGNNRALVTDAVHGDVVGVHTTTGTSLASSKAFDPWGKPVTTVGSPLSVRGFQGDWTDPNTGRVDMNARLYTPGSGVFTARDSVADPLNSNRYSYTAGNPMTAADPTGHSTDPYDPGFCDNPYYDPRASYDGGGDLPILMPHPCDSIPRPPDPKPPYGDGPFRNEEKASAGGGGKGGDSGGGGARSGSGGGRGGGGPATPKPYDHFDMSTWDWNALEGLPSPAGYNASSGMDFAGAGTEWDVTLGSPTVSASAAATTPKSAMLIPTSIDAMGSSITLAGHRDGQAPENQLEGTPTHAAACIAMYPGYWAVPGVPAGEGDPFQQGYWHYPYKSTWREYISEINLYGCLSGRGAQPGAEAWALARANPMLAILYGSEAITKICLKDEALCRIFKAISEDPSVMADGPGLMGSMTGGLAIGGLADDVIRPGALRYFACSFDGTTRVEMANGERKAIAEIEVGDEVLATDPTTGESGGRTVTSTFPHADELFTLKTSAGEIVTTEDHKYWNETDREWQESQELDEGDELLTADGDRVIVEGLDWSSVHTALAYDLSVADVHTYYVGAGDEAVLVHNCFDPDALSASGRAADKGGLTRAGRAYQKHMGRGELPHVGGAQLDEVGQNLLDDILKAPGTRIEQVTSGNFKGGVRYIRPDGTGATFDASGNLQYFGVGY